jgi:hypothetical protein
MRDVKRGRLEAPFFVSAHAFVEMPSIRNKQLTALILLNFFFTSRQSAHCPLAPRISPARLKPCVNAVKAQSGLYCNRVGTVPNGRHAPKNIPAESLNPHAEK